VKPEERFWSQVDIGKNGACWLWKGRKHQGYGRIYFKGKQRYVHRIAWELANGIPVPDGLFVLHSCDEPSCVNPSHLRLGNQAQNMKEMKERGRSTFGERNAAAKDPCRR
jgi:hypothetical protein